MGHVYIVPLTAGAATTDFTGAGAICAVAPEGEAGSPAGGFLAAAPNSTKPAPAVALGARYRSGSAWNFCAHPAQQK
jgi:hypothetical protein